MEELEFPGWEEPIDEEEIDAVLRAAVAASSSKKRLRPESDSRNPAVPQDGGDDRGSSGAIRPSDGRRLPNWGGTADPSPSSSKCGAAADGGTWSNGLTLCDGANGLWRVLSPPSCRQVDFKMKYPLMSFGGRIVYSRTASDVEKATMELLNIIKMKKGNFEKVTMGFDIEWRPTFKRGQIPRKAAVMQICVDACHCFVMHIIHSGIPSTLRSILEDSSCIKVGVSVANDALKILKDYYVQITPLDDLSASANLKLGGTPKKWSLSSLTEMLTCQELPKPNNIRLGDWEVDVLSRKQLHYAATDAFASWYLYEVLRTFPDASTNVGV